MITNLEMGKNILRTQNADLNIRRNWFRIPKIFMFLKKIEI